MSQNVNHSNTEQYIPLPTGSGSEEWITLTFPAVEGATGYRIYRTDNLDLLLKLRATVRKQKKAFNKRKKQRRARTGRRV